MTPLSRTNRRQALALGMSALALGLTVPTGALAQSTWPTRPVTIVVPFPPGGGSDIGARILAEQLTKRWGQPVIVENKGGAAGAIGADFVAKAKPDGYTLLMGNIGTQAINPSLYPKLPYDPDKAFTPIGLVAELPLAMMVHPSVPAKSVPDLIALAKSRPGQLSYSSSGAGGGPHLAAEMFKDATGTFILHVPYRGGGPAVKDLIAGHVQMSFMTVFEAVAHIKAGTLRALAVTGDKRVEAIPEVPTLAEAAVPNFNSISWLGLLAPAGTPGDLVERMAADVRAIVATADVKARLLGMGALPSGTTPVEFARQIEHDRKRYAQIIRDRKITVN